MCRDLNGIKVRQNHKSGYFNGNDLLELYNEGREVKKFIPGYLRSKGFKAFRMEVLKDILQNMQNLHVFKTCNGKEGEDLTDLEDRLCHVKRGKNGGTWMHPYIFMDFAMWLSPEFKLTCIKWIYDKLIQVRDEAGDGFKEVNNALFTKKPNTSPFTYSNEASMINKLVFGKPDKDQRNEATEDQLKMLSALQKLDIKLIEKGLDYYERYDELRRNKEMLKAIL